MENEMPEGVLRQRRNFLLFSLIVSAYIFLDIKISDISIFGIKLVVSNAENIFWVLVFFWLYFFWRFYQYTKKVPTLGVSNTFRGYFYRNLKPYLDKTVTKNYPKALSHHEVAFYNLKSKPLFLYEYNGELSFAVEGKDNHYKSEKVTLTFNKVHFIFPWFRACASLIFKESCFSDYVLPYLLGVLIFFYILIGKVMFA
ncbi:hypothetical protein [Colwellia sp. Bg11-28]|uniref:hypothetical protein n=1 Tax=Colwellia sp. Bg11-28 TaxID=2058305 RepID=UPI0012FEFD85|nr:hypothetical protein [Colwellia sp. Bg11-28]